MPSGRLVDDVGVEQLQQRRVEARRRRVGSLAAGSAAVDRREELVTTSAEQPRLPCPGDGRPGMRRQSPTGAAATQRAQRVAHRLLDHPLDADAVAKADLELGRMDVHVHVLGRGLEREVAATGDRPDGWPSGSPASAARTRNGSLNGRPLTKSWVRRPVG